MQLGDKYKIDSDSMNVTLYEKGASKSGNVYWRPIAYFSSFKNALIYIADLEVMKTGLKDFQEVVKKQDEIYSLVRSLEIA